MEKDELKKKFFALDEINEKVKIQQLAMAAEKIRPGAGDKIRNLGLPKVIYFNGLSEKSIRALSHFCTRLIPIAGLTKDTFVLSWGEDFAEEAKNDLPEITSLDLDRLIKIENDYLSKQGLIEEGLPATGGFGTLINHDLKNGGTFKIVRVESSSFDKIPFSQIKMIKELFPIEFFDLQFPQEGPFPKEQLQVLLTTKFKDVSPPLQAKLTIPYEIYNNPIELKDQLLQARDKMKDDIIRLGVYNEIKNYNLF